jgi:hypothetical protein
VTGEASWFTLLEPFDLPVFDPDGDEDDGAVVLGWSDGGGTVTSYAICMKGSDGASLIYDRFTSTVGPGTGGHGGSNNCGAADEELIGGGGGIEPTEQDFLQASEPFDADDWRVLTQHTNATVDRTFSATVVCIGTGFSLMSIKHAEGQVTGGGATKRVKVMCPAKRHVSAGGVDMFGSDSRLVSSRPIDGPDANHVPDDGWAGKVRNDGALPEAFQVSAVCVRP